MKTAGLIILIIIPILTANYLCASLKKRIELLEHFELLIKSVRTYIEFQKQPLTAIVGKLSREKEFQDFLFLEDVSKALRGGKDFTEAWNDAVTDFSRHTSLKAEDVSLFCSFAGGLGSTDVNGQLANCDTYIAITHSRLESLRSVSENKLKVYNALGLLTSSFVAVLVL